MSNIMPYWTIAQDTIYSAIVSSTAVQPEADRDLAVGANVMRLRKQKGLTQEQLASDLGITQTLISKYETGRLQISAEMIVRFAKALNVSSDTILGIQDDDSDGYSPSLKIMRRLREIENMAPSDQKALLKTIDKYIQSL